MSRALLQQISKRLPLGNLRRGIGLVESLLASEDPVARTLGEEVLAALHSVGGDAHATWLTLAPVVRHTLEHGSEEALLEALHHVSQYSYTPKYAAGLTAEQARLAARPTLERCPHQVVPHLASDSARVAHAAAKAVKELVRAGASLKAVRDAVERGLEHEAVGVRSDCSKALSHHLRRTGEEPELPHGAGYRRTYARSDTPVEGRVGVCALCGAKEIRRIYAADNGAQFYRLYTWETHCAACGRYFPEVFQAPG